jgi:hypothetical protein
MLTITKVKRRTEIDFNFCPPFYFSDSAGIRTQDPYIKSVLLYQLSYQIVDGKRYMISGMFIKRGAKL